MENNSFGFLMGFSLIFFILFCVPFADLNVGQHPKESKPIKHSLVKMWADKFGVELFSLGNFITRRKEVQDSFKPAMVVPRQGLKIIDQMAQEIKTMMDLKISAVKRILDAAENTAMSHQDDPVIPNFKYYNSKEMLQPFQLPPENITMRSLDDRSIKPVYVPPSYITLTTNPNFFNIAVNTTLSSVHIPTNVFDRTDEVLKAIQWSEKLDNIFLNNYQKDPTLSWQFFGSSTGFMRQFPASKWKADPVDLFDCRLRSWYIEAATSPKDMVILLDVSGSMMGQRKDIARHVVYNILDTLGTNDFVNIYKFDEHVQAVVPCFNETLVQATLANIRELKLGLESIPTDKIANYSAALIKAFEILEVYRLSDYGARCNQAIMLITDGVPYDFTYIFEMYNWQNNTYKPVRIFTYLIGKEVADVKKTKEMACTNQGFYVHLSTLAEVREQVLNYIPVMARPLVLGRHDHPVIWTQVYADVTDPQMTDWLWEVKECTEQKNLFLSQRQTGKPDFSTQERFDLRPKMNKQKQSDSDEYHLVTTVSMPVYDRRENMTNIANLLGVAGTDIPIKDLQKLMMPFTLGVNGYAFIVTNNGFVLTHPDLRPVFQGILKPAYNTIDMVEIELLDDNSDPRDFSKMLLDVREEIINQTSGSKYMLVKYHLDQMRRVSRIKRQYYWKPIENTPFTLVVTYPEQYGLHRVQIRYEDEIKRVVNNGNDLLSFFNGRHWKIHPDWVYCKHSKETFKSPEEELLYFLNRIKSPGWKWKDRTPQSPEHSVYSNTTKEQRPWAFYDKDAYFCDRSLIQELVFDAKVTEWFGNPSFKMEKNNVTEFKSRFGITVAFLATHSGLTRWIEFRSNTTDEVDKEIQNFGENNKRAIDEIWYKRAVEQHFIEPDSFVFSVPFDVGTEPDTLVTASHAIFHTEDKKSAPVAVVGFQFQHAALFTLFKNMTSNCVDCEKACFSDDPNVTPEVDCYVLDNNGYVIVSQELDLTGKFFGEVRGHLMQRLISEKIYQEVKINDYQAVCFEKTNDGSPGNILRTPWIHILRLLKLIGRLIIWSFVNLSLLPVDAYQNYDEYLYDSSTLEPMENRAEPPADDKLKMIDRSVIINRTRLQPCDQVITLFTLYPTNKHKSVYTIPAHGCERPFSVVPIPHSNLVLLVAERWCLVTDPDYKITTNPYDQTYSNYSLACHRSTVNLRRRRPNSCINRHINESFIEHCGRGYAFKSMNLLVLVFLICLSKAL